MTDEQTTMYNLRISSYNSTGFGNLFSRSSGPSPYIQTVSQQSDIILLQEHWLLNQQLHKVVTLLPEFTGTAISGLDESTTILRGRPYGGCAILWRQQLSTCIKPCDYQSMSRRVCGCVIQTVDFDILLLCVYFPTDKQMGESHLHDLEMVLHDINYFVENTPCTKLVIGGDFNCDFARDTHFVTCVRSFILSHQSQSAWDLFPIDFTHIHTDGVSTSTIDHIIVSHSLQISNAFTLHHIDNTSRHSAISVHVNCVLIDTQPMCDKPSHSTDSLPRCAWYKATHSDLHKYKECLETKLNNINVCDDLKSCNDHMCKNESHHTFIDEYCGKIISALQEASDFVPKTSSTKSKYRTPGWNEYVRPYRNDAQFWRHQWLLNGKPRFGAVADGMRTSRRNYHYAIRFVKRQDHALRKFNFLEAMFKDGRNFFQEIKRFKGTKPNMPNTVNGYGDHKEVANSFAKEYKELYNSCQYDASFPSVLYDTIAKAIDENEMSCLDFNFSLTDMLEAVSHIKRNKSDGAYNFMSDHFINAPNILMFHLAELLKMCLIHGYVPICLLMSTIIPIPKDRLGDLSTSNNYRGIALCALCMKIFEYAILVKHGNSLSSSHYQFAYKQNSSTTQCTWMAREVISYYKSNNSEIYGCFLDCSKAFDKIRYDILFTKLLDRGVSPIVLRFLLHSYNNSEVRIRWQGIESDVFHVKNGVRQGAVLSPFLFNIYIEELIEDLKRDGSGCWIGTHFYGVLVYADDILLLSPSLTSLQSMINTCEAFGEKNGLAFNPKKSMCIHFHKCGECTSSIDPHMSLNGSKLKWSRTVKHLGHTISCCLNFDKDLNIQKGKFIGCVNNIMTEFSFAHPRTKCRLMQIYGTSFYGSSLWDLYGSASTKLYTTWNIALRKLFKLPYRTHTRYLDSIANLNHISFSLKLRFISFIKNLLKSENVLIQNLMQYHVLNHVSPTGLALSRIVSEFDVCALSSFRSYQESVHTLMKKSYSSSHALTDEEASFCAVIIELMECMQGTQNPFLLFDECSQVIDFITTM